MNDGCIDNSSCCGGGMYVEWALENIRCIRKRNGNKLSYIALEEAAAVVTIYMWGWHDCYSEINAFVEWTESPI